MKVGILTFHCAHNYGAVLQAYALQQSLKELGHDVVIIDYTPNYLTKSYVIFSLSKYVYKNPLKSVKKIIFDLFTIKKRIKRFYTFDNFIKTNFSLSNSVKNKTQIPVDHDIYIMGSDQIWNTQITKGFDDIFLGNFTTSARTKKISYAASIGDLNMSEIQKLEFRNKVTNFDAISVRESSLKNSLQSIIKLKVTEVLDPTLLLDRKFWCEFALSPQTKERYVLVYQVARNKETIDIAKKIANEINAKVIEVSSRIQIVNKGSSILQTESPEQFLGWIKNAEYVVTTSFHGTAFSILLNKQFCSVGKKDSENNRLISLLKKVDLESRFITISADLTEKHKNPISWKRPNQLLQKHKNESVQFIKLNLKIK